jgi:hypothetical protein
MISGSIIALPDSITEEQLGKIVWQREEDELSLKSVFQFRKESFNIDSEHTAHKALVIHQYG